MLSLCKIGTQAWTTSHVKTLKESQILPRVLEGTNKRVSDCQVSSEGGALLLFQMRQRQIPLIYKSFTLGFSIIVDYSRLNSCSFINYSHRYCITSLVFIRLLFLSYNIYHPVIHHVHPKRPRRDRPSCPATSRSGEPSRASYYRHLIAFRILPPCPSQPYSVGSR